MHIESMKRAEWFVERFCPDLKGKRVLDVGSQDYNGCYAELFKSRGAEYVGVDISPGKNVDVVLRDLLFWGEDIPNDAYDIVICGQTLEHAEFFWVVVENMATCLKRGGLLCIIAPNNFEEHRYPVDCYRFFTDGMVALARWVQFEILHADHGARPGEWKTRRGETDAMLVARKPYDGIVKFPGYGYKVDPVKKNEYNKA